MMSPDEFITQWGTSNLFRPSIASVEHLDIPGSGKAFLLEAGLPISTEILPGTFSSVLPIPLEDRPTPRYSLFSRAYFLTSDCLRLTRLHRDVIYWINGDHWNGESVLFLGVEVGSGHVRVIGPHSSIHEPEVIEKTIDDFANSSIAHLLEFLVATRIFQAHYLFRWAYACHRVPSLIDSLEAKLHRIDGAAMADAENWWPKTLESLRGRYEHQVKVLSNTTSS